MPNVLAAHAYFPDPNQNTASTANPNPEAPPAVHLPRRALLTALSIHEWSARRRDREVTDRIAREHGAGRTAGCYTKTLVPPDTLAPIAQVRSAARTLHYRLTLPWCDDGCRILPVDLHLDYLARLRALRTQFHDAVAAFLTTYDDAKAAARQTLGTLYADADYPTPDRLRQTFRFEVALQPLPTGRDWRIDLPESTVAQLRRDLETRLADAQRLALADLHRRLADAVSRLATTLANPDRIFRDSLIGNLRELCRLLPSLNLTADPHLAALTRDVETRLAHLDPASLRHDHANRHATALDAQDLLDTITQRLATYTGPLHP